MNCQNPASLSLLCRAVTGIGHGRWGGEKGVQGQSPHEVLCCGPHLGCGMGATKSAVSGVEARRPPETSRWTLHKGDEENKNATQKKSTSRHVWLNEKADLESKNSRGPEPLRSMCRFKKGTLDGIKPLQALIFSPF